MKLVVQVKLLPTPEQAAALAATSHAVNLAAKRASAVAYQEFGLKARQVPLHRAVYAELRSGGLSAQAAVRVVKKVVDAYATLRGAVKAGNLGPEDSPRRVKATSKPVTSDGRTMQGGGLARYRRRMAKVRAQLQAKSTKSAKRKLKARARREARHATHVNHRIAKTVVADAERTGRGIALEDLHGIRGRTRVARHQRATHSSWPFHQLEEHITYKAQRAGVPVLTVDAHYTSQTCPRCGHVSRRNRPTRDAFWCVVCGLAGPADHIAAVNVRTRARRAWVHVNTPHAAVSPSSPSGIVTSCKPGPSGPDS
ncbi:RNA-guided endonuclease InsQ/TnpB family protein [Spirillospora sp. NPDC048911]|uniref:RNA-guided endonuclease InsQ/TnpB family protein n=1 Tax=Spirillospora sp. NPDC048911 TaxID=3364527 RepID=UPI003723F794